MFEIIGKLIQFKDNLLHNLFNNIIYVSMITKIKINLKEDHETEPLDIVPLIIEAINMQKNLNYIQENLYF